MTKEEIIKNLENKVCAVHGLHAEVKITGNNFSLKTCCEQFEKKLMEIINQGLEDMGNISAGRI